MENPSVEPNEPTERRHERAAASSAGHSPIGGHADLGVRWRLADSLASNNLRNQDQPSGDRCRRRSDANIHVRWGFGANRARWVGHRGWRRAALASREGRASQDASSLEKICRAGLRGSYRDLLGGPPLDHDAMHDGRVEVSHAGRRPRGHDGVQRDVRRPVGYQVVGAGTRPLRPSRRYIMTASTSTS